MVLAIILLLQLSIPVLAKNDDNVPYENEINDIFLLANPFGEKGIKGSMRLLVPDKDYFKVSFKEPGEVTFTLENIPLNRDYVLRVYDCSQKLLGKTAENKKTQTITLDSVKVKKTYYVMVTGKRKLLDKKQYYKLSYSQVQENTDPKVIEGEFTDVKLLNEKSEAWFSFTPDSTDSYTFTTTGGGDTYGVLYDSTKENILMENNDGFEDKGFLLGYTLQAGETYYIKVTANKYSEALKSFQLKTTKIDQPDDEEFYEQWYLMNPSGGMDINVLPLWTYSRGAGVKVAVLDTGVDYNHFDLAENINMDLAYNFFHGIKDVFPDAELHTGFGNSAKAGHGTKSASVIGAVADNGAGIAGIAPKSSIVPLKVMGNPFVGEEVNNGSVTAFLDSLQYLYENNIPIANCSFGGDNPSISEQQAMLKAKNTLFLIAAGNDSYDLSETQVYPACYYNSNSVVIMGCTRDGEPTPFTNYGGPTNIAAPGQSVYCLSPYDETDYAAGTSIAAPFASGVAALLLGQDPSLTPEQLRDMLIGKDSVDTNPELQGYSTSGGTLNALKAALAKKTDARLAPTPAKNIFGTGDGIKTVITNIKDQASDDQKTQSIIMKLESGQDIEAVLSVIQEENEDIEVKEYKYFSFIDAYEVVFESVKEADQAVDIFNQYDTIQYAEPNYVRTIEKQQ